MKLRGIYTFIIRLYILLFINAAGYASAFGAGSTIFSPLAKEIKPSNSKSTLVLIGFDTGTTSSDKNSYGKMYDNVDSQIISNYQPLTTVGLERAGDSINLYVAPYLIAPTVKGFKYINLINNKTKVTANSFDDSMDQETYSNYKWESDDTRVFITSNKSDIVRTLNKTVTNEDALSTHFEKLDYLTPEFVLKTGYTSEVHSGATAFNAHEFVDLQSFANKYPHKLNEIITNKKYISILRTVHKEIYDSDPKGDESFPWDYSGPWHKKNDGIYSLFRKHGSIHLNALIPVWGNSARSFLADYDAGLAPKSIVIQKPFPMDFRAFVALDENVLDVFVAPNNATVYILTKTHIHAYDTSTGNRLAYYDLRDLLPNGIANKVIMVEWAVGKYVSRWKDVFTYEK